jgi:ferredoxin-NADP reductase
VVSVHLTGHHLDELPVRAGQFMLFRFLTRPGASRAHPYSLSAAPLPTALRITVKELGDDSRQIARLRPGTRVLVEGPYGRLTAERRTGRKVLLLGAGIGVTPLRALAAELPQRPGDVVLVHRVSSLQEAVFRSELERLKVTRGMHVVWLPGPRDGQSWAPIGTGSDGAAALRTVVPDVAERDVYVCGPDTWMEAAVDAARRAGVPGERIHAERFSW